jgi:hypothetical protein
MLALNNHRFYQTGTVVVGFVYYSIMGEVVGCRCSHDDENLPAGRVATTTPALLEK